MSLKDLLTAYGSAPRAQVPRVQALRAQVVRSPSTLRELLAYGMLPPAPSASTARPKAQRSVPPGTFTRLLRGVDIFAGAGGFTIGAVNAGCPITLAADWSPAAVQTSRRAGHPAEQMNVADVGMTDQATLYGVDVLIGGPPCQNFSSMGKRAGAKGEQNMFPIALDAVEYLEPKRVVFENVKDFLIPKHQAFREEVMTRLAKSFRYVGIWVLNAKDFGVPQDRKRVFVWGAEVPLEPPVPTHGPLAGTPYRTVAQVLPNLGAPALHTRSYTAKSRSVHEPSPTVMTGATLYTAERPGLVYGRDPHKGRALTVSELGVLQGFPDFYTFMGNKGDQHTQVGNAVPPLLGEAVVRAVLAGMRAERLKPSRVLDLLKEENPEAFLLEPRLDAKGPQGERVRGFDHALLGVTNTSKSCPGKLVAVYDRDLLVEIAMDHDFAYGDGLDPEDEDDREQAFSDAHAWLDSVESGMYYDDKPYPVILRRNPDQMDPDEEEAYAQGSENRRWPRRRVRRLGWLSV